jgi:hypothetical protein
MYSYKVLACEQTQMIIFLISRPTKQFAFCQTEKEWNCNIFQFGFQFAPFMTYFVDAHDWSLTQKVLNKTADKIMISTEAYLAFPFNIAL